MNAPGKDAPITKYALQELGWRDFWRVFIPLTALALLPLGYGLWRTLYGYSSFGPAAAAAWGRNWFLVSAGLTIPVLLYALIRLRRAHTWVKVFSWGLQFKFPSSRKRVVKWEEIQGITSYSVSRTFLRIFSRTRHHLLLYTGKGRPLRCHPNLKDRDGLKKTIKKQVYQRLQPRLSRALKDGALIPFGGLSISREKIVLPSVEIPWEFIEGITVEKGIFVINLTAASRIEIPIRKIINLEILIHLIKSEI